MSYVCVVYESSSLSYATLPVKMFGLGQKVLSHLAWSKFWPILANQETLAILHENEANFFIFFRKKNFKMADWKKAYFPKSPILKKFSRKFHGLVLGLVGLNDAKPIDFAQAKCDNTFWPRPNILTGSVVLWLSPWHKWHTWISQIFEIGRVYIIKRVFLPGLLGNLVKKSLVSHDEIRNGDYLKF